MNGDRITPSAIEAARQGYNRAIDRGDEHPGEFKAALEAALPHLTQTEPPKDDAKRFDARKFLLSDDAARIVCIAYEKASQGSISFLPSEAGIKAAKAGLATLERSFYVYGDHAERIEEEPERSDDEIHAALEVPLGASAPQAADLAGREPSEVATPKDDWRPRFLQRLIAKFPDFPAAGNDDEKVRWLEGFGRLADVGAPSEKA
jgi:hypothetical protein